MAFLKDLIVTGASQFLDGITVSKINVPISSGSTSYGAGTSGQVLLSNGSNIYWGSAAPTVTESTVSGWGFTKNGGTVTSVGATGTNGITISGSPITSSGSITIGLNLSTAINTLSEGSSPANRNDYAVVQYAGGGTSTTTYHRRKLSNVFAALNSSDITTALGNQNANVVLAGPSSGSAAAPAFRKLVAADIDGLDISALNNDIGYITSADVPEGASAYTGTIKAVGTTASNGSNNGFARGDHIHNISLATGDSNGQVKIAGTNISVKGLAAAAYKGVTDNSSATAVTSTDTNLITGRTLYYAGYLTSHQTIKQDGITGATINRFGICSTDAATAAKTVNITTGDFSLEAGTMIAVKFSNSNTASTPTLNVNSTGAKNIFVNGSQITTSSSAYGLLKGTVIFVYDGTQYHLIGNYYNSNTNTLLRTYASSTALEVPLIGQNSAASATAAWTSYTSGYKDWYGAIPASENKRVKINLSTGELKVNGGKVTIGTNSLADKAQIRLYSDAGYIELFSRSDASTKKMGCGAVINETYSWIYEIDQDANKVFWGRADSNVLKSGDTMTGNLKVTKAGDAYIEVQNSSTQCRITLESGNATKHGLYSSGYYNGSSYTNSGSWILYRGSDGYVHSDTRIYGAVWNDYAEMRNVPEAQEEKPILKPGMCVHENGDGTMTMSVTRLERGCKVISDTFGFNIGETEECKTPIAVSGRALVYINEGREMAFSHIGWPVCSGPNGTVSIMTEEEEKKYPSRIIGTISEIPNYEEWGAEKVKVNGRIWIYVK